MTYRMGALKSEDPYDVVELYSDDESDDEVSAKSKNKFRQFTPIELDEDQQEAIDLTGEDDDDFIRELTPNELKTAQSKKAAPGGVMPGYRLANKATTDLRVDIFPSTEEQPFDLELEDGDFLRVMNIYKHIFTREVVLKGILLRRTRRVHGYLKKDSNELCAIVQQDDNGGDPALGSSLVIRPLAAVICSRKIIFTNQDFPTLSFRFDAKFVGLSPAAIEATAPLVCRTKYVEYANAATGKVMMEAVVYLVECEADPGKGMSDIVKKNRWLQKSQKEGPTKSRQMSGFGKAPVREASADHKQPKSQPASAVIDLTTATAAVKRGIEEIDLTRDEDGEEVTHKFRKTSITDTFRLSKRRETLFERTNNSITNMKTIKKLRSSSISSTNTFGRKEQDLEPYAYGDICAGAGGMTRAAAGAGFNIYFVLDHWSTACDTLRRNWPMAKVLEASIFDFCAKMGFEGYMRVDVLHISFPCQTHSLAHTRPGKNDDDNEAAAMSIVYLLKKCRPRVVTFEQTWSILCEKRRPHFQALAHQLTILGYSVRWKIFNCAEYGNVQPRKRLFIIASCSGEPLPPFPKPTHGQGPGRKPFVTIQDRLALVPHQLSPRMQQHTAKSAAPYNPNCILRHAITCNGGEGDIHPSGKRSFNMAELASLGGFPSHHRFTGTMTDIRKQIGNAVPSMVGKAIAQEIKKSMRKADKDEATRQARLRHEAILIDSRDAAGETD